MRFSQVAAASLVGSVGAFNFGEHDALSALGVFNLGLDAAINGLPNPGQCTLKNVAIRREWCVYLRLLYCHIRACTHILSQVAARQVGETELHRRHKVYPQEARLDPLCNRIRSKEPIR